MGLVHAELELVNANDIWLAKRHQIGQEEIKRITITALVDSGAVFLAINENIQEYLQLDVIGRKSMQMADNSWVECDVVGPVEIRFQNRDGQFSALVMPGDSEPLLGVIPMEAMDVLIDPLRQQLIVNPKHPDFAVCRL